jgi:tetratricopeptide (TPR) repeat protein
MTTQTQLGFYAYQLKELATLTAANTLSNVAFVHYKEGNTQESLRLYEEALALKRDYLDDDDPKVTVIRDNVKYLVETAIIPAYDPTCFLENPLRILHDVFHNES